MRLFGFLITILILLQIQFASAQSVGVGITNPAARLDITKPGGDTPTLNIRGTANVSHFNHGAAEHTYIRGGKAASNVLINDYPGSGSIGFGTANPNTRFHFFSGSSGNAFPNGLMALEGNNSTYLNILAPDANETGLLFGKASDAVSGGIVYNNSANLNSLQFRTSGNINRMVIDANGNVGIGNNNPEFALDVANRIRIRSGGGFSSAGLYFNKNDNSSVAGFIGMQDDMHIGFWGNPVGWALTMNTNNGALRIFGNEGTSGQALTSTGNGSEWRSPTKAVFDNSVMKIQGDQLALLNGNPAAEIPGLTHTFTAASTTKILVNFHFFASSGSCAGCGSSHIYVDLQLNGGAQTRAIKEIGNGAADSYDGSYFLQVGPGTHTIRLVAFVLGSNGYIRGSGYADTGKLILVMIPE